MAVRKNSSHSRPSANGVQVPSIIGAVYVRLSIDLGSLRYSAPNFFGQ